MAFWDEVIQGTWGDRPWEQAWDELQRVASFRPTVYIGLGGIGSMVVRKMKQAIQELIPDDDVRQGFAYLALDTHPRERTDILDPNEYLELSVGVEPRVVVSQPQHQRTLGWYRELTGRWVAPSIRGGANKIRVIGRFAFCYGPTTQRFCDALTNIRDRILQFRDKFGAQVEPKLYIISSIAGGTGSGILLDVIAVTKGLLAAVPCKRQAILILPDVLQGEAPAVDIPDLYANTYATLKEIYRLFSENAAVSYAPRVLDGIRTIDNNYLPNPIYVLSSRNVHGIGIVRNSTELADIIVNYLLSEIQTPLEVRAGQPKVQDAENVDLQGLGNSEMYRCFSSIGMVRFGFPEDIVRDIFTWAVLDRALQEEIQEGVGAFQAEADVWVRQQQLSEAASDQLQEGIRKDPQGKPIRITVDVVGRLADVRRTDLPGACERLSQELVQSLGDQYKNIFHDNMNKVKSEALQSLGEALERAVQDRSVGYALAWARALQAELTGEERALSEEQTSSQVVLHQAHQMVQTAIQSVRDAAQSGFLGRRGRIQAALSAFELELNSYLNQQLVLWSQEMGREVYNELLQKCADFIQRWEPVHQRLKALQADIRQNAQRKAQELDRMANLNVRGPGNRFSLVDAERMHVLYREWVSEEQEASLARETREWWRHREQNLLGTVTVLDPQEWISKASEPIRQRIADIINQRADLVNIIDRFYRDQDLDRLFTNLRTLASPLYPLNNNYVEEAYPTSWVVATHPSIRDRFQNLIRRYVPPGAGINDAYFSNRYEVVIYTIEHGYTPHSLQFIGELKAHYDNLQRKYVTALARGIPQRPVHVWPGAERAPDLIPRPPSEEEAYQWFILGRAFSYLFPHPSPQKNKAFIYNRGNRYYILDDSEREQLIGTGLAEAVENFEYNPEWKTCIQRRVQDRIQADGTYNIRSRLEDYIRDVLQPEIETARRNNESERAELLTDLLNALRKYMDRDLRVVQV